MSRRTQKKVLAQIIGEVIVAQSKKTVEVIKPVEPKKFVKPPVKKVAAKKTRSKSKRK